MFNGLARFFFGGAVGGPSTSSSPSSSPTCDHSEPSAPTASAVSYTTTETDDGDWLLVDSNRRRPQAYASSVNCQLTTDVSTAVAPSSVPSTAPSSPTQGIAILDGSWYLTPPPCFTADSPVAVEMSPMENLLIEHPSMSVYASCSTSSSSKPSIVLRELTSAPIDGKVNGRRVGTGGGSSRHRRKRPVVRQSVADQPLPSVTDKLDADVEMPVEDDGDVIPSTRSSPQTTTTTTSSSAAAVAARGELLLHIKMHAHSQKACRDRETRGVHRRQLDRHNKVLEYRSLGKRQRRKDFMKSHSGANNNRKC